MIGKGKVVFRSQLATGGTGGTTTAAAAAASNKKSSSGGNTSTAAASSSSSTLAIATALTSDLTRISPGTNGGRCAKVLNKLSFVMAGEFDEVNTHPSIAYQAIDEMIQRFGGTTTKKMSSKVGTYYYPHHTNILLYLNTNA